MDETDAFGKGEKCRRVTNQNPPRARPPHGVPGGLGEATVDEDRSFEALCSLKITIFSG